VLGQRLALLKNNMWTRGQGLRVGFLSGSSVLQGRVQAVAKEWEQYCSLSLHFVPNPGDADIRIDFSPDGSWSFVGTQCKQAPAGSATMNFGWLTEDSDDDEVHRVVLHEFGHALGCIHEHQHPAANIQWNKQAVYAYYMGPPNNWTKEQVDHNIFETYSKEVTNSTQKADPGSIMMYPIPRNFLLTGDPVGMNRKLSDRDKSFIRAMYP